MFKQLRINKKLYLISSVSSYFASLQYQSNSSCQQDMSNNEDILYNSLLVSLNSTSQQNLTKHLNKLGYDNVKCNRYVIISRDIEEDNYFLFEPLLNERTSFRLTGIIIDNNNNIMATGKVSSMAGQIGLDNYNPSIPLNNNYNYISVDIPTRLSKNINSSKDWQGSLHEQIIKGVRHKSINIEYIHLPFDKQTVVDGRLCMGKYLSEDGNCNFDRTTITPIMNASNNKEDLSNQSECPLCLFMKKGSCKDSFISWDNCLSNIKDGDDLSVCVIPTYELMKCMRKDEYYDIMITNSDDKMLELEKMANTKKN